MISEITNDIAYSNGLLNHSSVKNRLPSNQLRDWNELAYGHKSNLILLEIQSYDVETQVSNAQSRYDTGFLKVAANLVVELQKAFPTPSTAYAPAYAAQYRLSLSVKENMKAKGIDMSNLHFQTVDSIQGLGYDIGVIEVTLTDSNSLDFINELHRLSMLFTRSKCGF